MLIHGNLPPEFDGFLAELSGEPMHVRAMWRYAIVLLMIDTEAARILETHQDGPILHLILMTQAGERFEAVRPDISEELEQKLLEKVREIFDEETADGPMLPLDQD